MHFAGGKWIWVDQEEPVYKRSKGKGKGQTKGKSKGGKAKGKGKRILGYCGSCEWALSVTVLWKVQFRNATFVVRG